MVKRLLKRLVPQHLRQLRYALYDRIQYLPVLLWNLGNRLQCPFCGWRFRSFRPGGPESPLFARQKVIPGGRRPNVSCPRCDSNDRERHLFLFLKNKTDLFSRPVRLLHLAPEPCLRRAIEAHSSIRCVTADLEDPRVAVWMDVTRIPHREDTFDVILCNHVLEHVPDDRKAMTELLRVLRPGGWAVLQVPIAPDLLRTLEDPSVRSPGERLRLYGQKDHLRLYGSDYTERLAAAGFDVTVCDYQEELGAATCARHALLSGEKLFVCRKPAAA